MESRCAICGSRTQEMDLAEIKVEGVCVKACPYCRKQLAQFKQNPEHNAEWLANVLCRDVQSIRTPETTAALTRLAYRNHIARPAEDKEPPAKKAAAAQNHVEPLERRVEALENQLRRLKRRLMISKILEIVLPLLVALVLLVVLLRSGYLQNIFDYFSTLEDLANQM